MKNIKILYFILVMTIFCSCSQNALKINNNINTIFDNNKEEVLWEKDSYKFEIVKDNIDSIDGVFLKIKYTNLNKENKDLKLTINSVSLNGLNNIQEIIDDTETSILNKIIQMNLTKDNIYEFSYLYNEALGELKYYKLNLSCTVNNRTWEIPIIEKGIKGEVFVEIDSRYKIYTKNNKFYCVDSDIRFPVKFDGIGIYSIQNYKPIETIYFYSSKIPYEHLNENWTVSDDCFTEINFIDDNYETALYMLEQEGIAISNIYEDINLLKMLHDLRNK